MSVLGSIGKGALSSLTGNVETAILVVHDFRYLEEGTGLLDALKGAVSAATSAVLGGGSAPSYDGSKDKYFRVHFNPSQLTLNASSIPKGKTSVKKPANSRLIAAESPKLILTVSLYFDDMQTYDAFMMEKFSAGLSAQGVANMARMGAEMLGLSKPHSVQPQVESLISALRNPQTRYVSFRWADFAFIGQLSAVQAQYTMFSTSGRPVRAQVLLRIQHELDPSLLNGWYKDFDTAFGKSSGLLGAIGGSVQNVLNVNL